MPKPSPDNTLLHARSCELDIAGTAFRFSVTRQQVHEFQSDSEGSENPVSAQRNYLLRWVDPEQRGALQLLFDDPENFTLENKVFGAVVPFLLRNSATLSEPRPAG